MLKLIIQITQNNNTINFKPLENAVILNAIFKELSVLSDYTTTDRDAKLFKGIITKTIKEQRHDLRENFKALTRRFKDQANNTIFTGSCNHSLTIEYQPENLLIPKDNDSTPSALLITDKQ